MNPRTEVLIINDASFSHVTKSINGKSYGFYALSALNQLENVNVARLPFTIKVLLEALLRQIDGFQIRLEDVKNLALWNPTQRTDFDIPFKPSRVILQDLTGVPAVVDLASMRSSLAEQNGNPNRINPLVPVDLVIDHSVQVDSWGTPQSFQENMAQEYQRNQERYRLLKWAQSSFENFRVVPPDAGIVHQINLEYLAPVVHQVDSELFLDTVVGTDSHTTMINGLGILGWGVGGIEAEANMLGQPLYILPPDVIGVEVTGHLSEGTTATDLALTITQMLRREGVVGKFIEFFGPGLSSMSLADRATIANMAPEYGATVSFFPVDEEALRYLALTGRSPEDITVIREYLWEQGLFRTDETPAPTFTRIISINLEQITPSLAGPKRPQDRIALSDMKQQFVSDFGPRDGSVAPSPSYSRSHPPSSATIQAQSQLTQGSVVIAAITSCTNTSNPFVMVAAGLLAKKAVEFGLTVAPHVKTSLAPGSRVVTAYLERANLLPYLEQLGFYVVGYGCTTCIGNSGPLDPDVQDEIRQNDLTVAAVLSGNRNFEGRIHPLVKANYLASPPLVVLYALTGTIHFDVASDPVGYTPTGDAIFFKDLWPSHHEVESVLAAAVQSDLYQKSYQEVFAHNDLWDNLTAPQGDLYQWDIDSTYIQRPPFLQAKATDPQDLYTITDARALAYFGDSVTTDHISPAGSIPKESPAGQYLMAHGVGASQFNSYGARRGNHEVMIRGTFANIRIKNRLLPGTEGGVTVHWPDKTPGTIFDIAMQYQHEETSLVILAGKEYGTGSSRDWAAKGTRLLGVKAVLVQSFERIHRSNLAGMGVLPLEFMPGTSAEQLGLTGEETFTITLPNPLKPKASVAVSAIKMDGQGISFSAICRLDTPVEVEYYLQGGILPTVVHQMANPGQQ